MWACVCTRTRAPTDSCVNSRKKLATGTHLTLPLSSALNFCSEKERHLEKQLASGRLGFCPQESGRRKA